MGGLPWLVMMAVYLPKKNGQLNPLFMAINMLANDGENKRASRVWYKRESKKWQLIMVRCLKNAKNEYI